nr:MAG: RNA-dependent RNA polymerase [Crogonang virus 49]
MYYCKVGDGFQEPPAVSRAVINTRLNAFKYKLRKCFGAKPTRLSPIEFVEMFQGRKRKIYEGALDEYVTKGVQKKHAVSVAFVKCEKVPPNKAPRCIQPRHQVYNIGVGSYLKHIEHRIYNAISRVFGDDDIVVAKGVNVVELGAVMEKKWASFSRPCAVGMDATKFDMHVSAEMLQWEHSFYQLLYQDKELTRLLQMQVDNRGVGYCDDGKLRYRVKGRRFSGDMNTALGNCLIMCAMVWSYAKEKGIPIKFINNGDDCVVFMEQEHYQTFAEGLDLWFLDLGFRMVVEAPVFELAQVEFCQMRCIPTSRGAVMVRNFDKAREKDSCTFLPVNTADSVRKWMWAVGECGLALTSGVPVMQEYYKFYMRTGLKGKVGNSVQMMGGALFLAQRLEARESPILPESRVAFMSAWGITPDEQVALEEYYRTLEYTHNRNHTDNFELIDSAPY